MWNMENYDNSSKQNTNMALGLVEALMSDTFLCLKQSLSVSGAVFLLFLMPMLCWRKCLQKNGFVTLMCITYLWFTFKWSFVGYLGFCLSCRPLTVIHNPQFYQL